ncbi:MAG: hypothetical protein K0Q49_68 [Haloplasmataceae bacterium]|jgi:hypothetical protein|nr:hypothetical protein [Haloplasmataceae bacterium]
MDNKKTKKIKFNFSHFIIAFVYFFFVIYQFLKISNLNLSYLGEALSTKIIWDYLLILFLIPIFAFLFIYLPGLLIIHVEFSFLIKSNNINLKTKFRLNDVHFQTFLVIKSIFKTRYRVMRC